MCILLFFLIFSCDIDEENRGVQRDWKNHIGLGIIFSAQCFNLSVFKFAFCSVSVS